MMHHTHPYEQEAKNRWGHTDAWKQSQERVGKLSREALAAIGAEGEAITKAVAALAAEGRQPSDMDVQALIARHYAWLRNFYDPSAEMYRGLGDLYVEDARFSAHYEQYGPNLAAYMREAMHAFCKLQNEH